MEQKEQDSMGGEPRKWYISHAHLVVSFSEAFRRENTEAAAGFVRGREQRSIVLAEISRKLI